MMAAQKGRFRSGSADSRSSRLQDSCLNSPIISEKIHHRRRRRALLVLLIGTAALSIQSILSPQLWDILYNENNIYHEEDVIIDDQQHYDENYVEGDADAAAVPPAAAVAGVGRRALSPAEEMEMQYEFHRILMEDELMDGDDAAVLAIPSSAEVASVQEEAAAAAAPEDYTPPATPVTPHTKLIDTNQPLPPYTIADAIDSTKMFDHTFAFLVYDPNEDIFYGLYSKRHYWVTGCEKLLGSFRNLVYILRKLFPERFLGEGRSDELVIPISSGDYPGVRTTCLDHFRKESTNPRTPKGWQALMGKKCAYDTAPILHFGSVFRQPSIFPSMIAMPMPEPHNLYCFEHWVTHGSVCSNLRPKGSEGDRRGELVFGEEFGLRWEDLIPQVVWRGTDFSYLTKVVPTLRKPTFDEKMIKWPFWNQSKENKEGKRIGGLTAAGYAKKKRRLERVKQRAPKRGRENVRMLADFNKAAAVHALRGMYKDLLPRWQAVVLTADAEAKAATEPIGAHGNHGLPWANMKFSSYVHGGSKTRTEGADHYKDWENIGFATGEYMRLAKLATYKYQIDLGGGGGTTWSGTQQKLAMPGLLFHHMTPTKDYFHDLLKPWVHFVPVSADLRDLKRKFDWAEAHPEEAKKIADEGTKLMRYIGSPEGFEDWFKQDMTEPLRRVIEAYQPIKNLHAEGKVPWRNWKEALRQIEGDDAFIPVIKCSGHMMGSCEDLMGRKWLRGTLTHRNQRHFVPGKTS